MIPTKLPDGPDELLRAIPKAIVHLRSQLERKRLGLIFGSGASKDLDFPDWQTLVAGIAKHKHVRGEELIKHLFPQSPKPDGNTGTSRIGVARGRSV